VPGAAWKEISFSTIREPSVLLLVSVATFGKTNANSKPALYSHEFLQSASYAWALMASDGPVLKADLNAAFVKLESKRHRTFDEICCSLI
jgi:hypothetical protein